ncbi:hypothetical protein ABZX30_29835 [Streptomyces sp. NPDC004542]|uniref:hypothetical protein n=1 Tax=Streptomyces sp. NPDC004542 TaxID=3154281 RepID=UPI0033A16392
MVWCDADGGLMPNTYKWLADDIGASLVESGGVTKDGRPKCHVYIKLDRSTPDFQIEALNKALAKKIDQLNGFKGADPSKCHRASLLRVPGTINHKHRDECPMGCYDGHEGVTA